MIKDQKGGVIGAIGSIIAGEALGAVISSPIGALADMIFGIDDDKEEKDTESKELNQQYANIAESAQENALEMSRGANDLAESALRESSNVSQSAIDSSTRTAQTAMEQSALANQSANAMIESERERSAEITDKAMEKRESAIQTVIEGAKQAAETVEQVRRDAHESQKLAQQQLDMYRGEAAEKIRLAHEASVKTARDSLDAVKDAYDDLNESNVVAAKNAQAAARQHALRSQEIARRTISDMRRETTEEIVDEKNKALERQEYIALQLAKAQKAKQDAAIKIAQEAIASANAAKQRSNLLAVQWAERNNDDDEDKDKSNQMAIIYGAIGLGVVLFFMMKR